MAIQCFWRGAVENVRANGQLPRMNWKSLSGGIVSKTDAARRAWNGAEGNGPSARSFELARLTARKSDVSNEQRSQTMARTRVGCGRISVSDTSVGRRGRRTPPAPIDRAGHRPRAASGTLRRPCRSSALSGGTCPAACPRTPPSLTSDTGRAARKESAGRRHEMDQERPRQRCDPRDELPEELSIEIPNPITSRLNLATTLVVLSGYGQ